MTPYPRQIERTVKPREKKPTPLPVIAYHPVEGIVLETTGERLPASDLPTVLLNHRSAIVVCEQASVITYELTKGAFADNPQWQFKAVPTERQFYRPNREKATVFHQSVISFFGFKRKNGHGKNKYFYPLDPSQFHGAKTSIVSLRDTDETELERLFIWGTQVRDWAVKQGLKVTPTQGGMAGQLLRDPRFYPSARRKIPKATNQRAREALPGNFYQRFMRTDVDGIVSTPAALCIDLQSAHHNIAASLQFPDADGLMARGRFRRVKRHEDGSFDNVPVWLTRGTPQFEKVLAEHKGLFYCHISVGQYRDPFVLPFMQEPGTHDVFLFSNEIDFIERFCQGTEFKIEAIYAAWTSKDIEAEGLRKYAEWAMGELFELRNDPDPYRRNWLKPLLLSTYGILGAKPKQLRFGFYQAEKGKSVSYPMGGPNRLDVMQTETTRELEPNFANAIHLGMIHAEQRTQSLLLARHLHWSGQRVIEIYADSVFVVDNGNDLPNLPDGWIVKERHTNFVSLTKTHWVSDQGAKLPGIARQENRERIRRNRRVVEGSI